MINVYSDIICLLKFLLVALPTDVLADKPHPQSFKENFE